jgi:hypothetical protein
VAAVKPDIIPVPNPVIPPSVAAVNVAFAGDVTVILYVPGTTIPSASTTLIFIVCAVPAVAGPAPESTTWSAPVATNFTCVEISSAWFPHKPEFGVTVTVSTILSFKTNAAVPETFVIP